MVLRTDLVNADTALNLHPDQHNEVNQKALDLETAHGLLPLTLQDVYDNGASSADSKLALDSTRAGIEIQDTNVPLPGGPFKITGFAGSPTYFSINDIAGGINVPFTFTAELKSPGGGASSTKLGTQANALGANSTAIGHTAQATATATTSLGNNADAGGVSATAIGEDSDASGDGSIAAGKSSVASATAASAYGEDAQATGANSTAVGNNAQATDSNTLAAGVSAVASGENSVSLGNSSAAPGDNSVAVGRSSVAGTAGTDHNASAFGYLASAAEEYSSAFGQGATASADGATALGQGSTASGVNALAVGFASQATDAGAVAIGDTSQATAASSSALGDGASATHARATALGESAATTKADQIVLGKAADEVLVPGDLEVSKTITSKGNLDVGTLGGTGAVIRALGSGAGIGVQAPILPLITIENVDETDADGGRMGLLGFIGETSAGTAHTLAYLLASHAGSGTDQRGQLDFHVNTGAQGNAPSRAARLTRDGDWEIEGALQAQGELEFALGTSSGSILTDGSAATDQRTVSFPDNDVDLGEDLVCLQWSRGAIGPSQTGLALYTGQGAFDIVFPWAATVVALSAAADKAQSGGDTGTVHVQKNGTNQTFIVIDSSNQRRTATGISVSYAAGDYASAAIDTTSGWTTSTRVSFQAWARVQSL